MRHAVEKGVDNAIATDLIRLAWEGAYDWAVLASSIHGAFPPHGAELSRRCWASANLGARRSEFARA